jgi:MIP family channel proteins
VIPKTLRPLAAEFVGTALFVFLGAGSVVMNAHTAGALGAVGVALAHGVALAIVVSMTMNISGGHLNPAVTAALWVADKVDGRTAASYVVGQLVGALVGAALVKGLLPVAAVRATLAGAPKLAETVTFMQGVWIEAVLTFFLVSAVFGTAVSPEAPKIGGFGIGLAVAVDALVGGSLTGAAMNPARAFGPAVASADLHGQAVWWIGPLLGAGAAGWLWRTVLLPKKS